MFSSLGLMMTICRSKAKAQQAIGLDTQKLNEKKQKFMDEIVPKWIDEVKKSGKLIQK